MVKVDAKAQKIFQVCIAALQHSLSHKIIAPSHALMPKDFPRHTSHFVAQQFTRTCSGCCCRAER